MGIEIGARRAVCGTTELTARFSDSLDDDSLCLESHRNYTGRTCDDDKVFGVNKMNYTIIEVIHAGKASPNAGSRIGFGGDRSTTMRVRHFMLNDPFIPACLIVIDGIASSRSQALRKCVQQTAAISAIKQMVLNFVILVRFQPKVPKKIVDILRKTILNLQPAYVPDKRGWHTPGWAILNPTCVRATLHLMNEKLGEGDILHQCEFLVVPLDTAAALDQKSLGLRFEVFREAGPGLVRNQYRRTRQSENAGLTHRNKDFAATRIQKLGLKRSLNAGTLIRRLRVLSTNPGEEECNFEQSNRKFQIQMSIVAAAGPAITELSWK